ncbi:hypothetical protein C8R47DRAFT_532077 [Mycena vitilis]|nr:hypothetical protein C8R47DRAFT_532077 [Mycena vitilis]
MKKKWIPYRRWHHRRGCAVRTCASCFREKLQRGVGSGRHVNVGLGSSAARFEPVLASCLISLIEDQATTLSLALPSPRPLFDDANSGIGGSPGDRLTGNPFFPAAPQLQAQHQAQHRNRSSVCPTNPLLAPSFYSCTHPPPAFWRRSTLQSVDLSPCSFLHPAIDPLPPDGVHFVSPFPRRGHFLHLPTHRTLFCPTKTRRQTGPTMNDSRFLMNSQPTPHTYQAVPPK